MAPSPFLYPQISPSIKENMRRDTKLLQSPRLFVPHSPHPLSSHALRAKLAWEAKYGEPCPYTRSAGEGCPYISHDGTRTPGRAKGDCARRFGDSSRLREAPSFRPSEAGRWPGRAFSDWFDQGADLDYFDHDATGFAFSDNSPAVGSGSSAARTATARRGGRRPHRVAEVKPGRWKRAATLLEIHQRVIKAAMFEASRPYDKPFENLSERLGGEPYELTYREGSTGVRGGLGIGGGLPGGVRGRSSTAGEMRSSALARDRLDSRSGAGFRSQATCVERETFLPRFEDGKEKWKISLLRSTSASAGKRPTIGDRSRSIANSDAFSTVAANHAILDVSDRLEDEHRDRQDPCADGGSARGAKRGSGLDGTVHRRRRISSSHRKEQGGNSTRAECTTALEKRGVEGAMLDLDTTESVASHVPYSVRSYYSTVMPSTTSAISEGGVVDPQRPDGVPPEGDDSGGVRPFRFHHFELPGVREVGAACTKPRLNEGVAVVSADSSLGEETCIESIAVNANSSDWKTNLVQVGRWCPPSGTKELSTMTVNEECTIHSEEGVSRVASSRRVARPYRHTEPIQRGKEKSHPNSQPIARAVEKECIDEVIPSQATQRGLDRCSSDRGIAHLGPGRDKIYYLQCSGKTAVTAVAKSRATAEHFVDKVITVGLRLCQASVSNGDQTARPRVLALADEAKDELDDANSTPQMKLVDQYIDKGMSKYLRARLGTVVDDEAIPRQLTEKVRTDVEQTSTRENLVVENRDSVAAGEISLPTKEKPRTGADGSGISVPLTSYNSVTNEEQLEHHQTLSGLAPERHICHTDGNDRHNVEVLFDVTRSMAMSAVAAIIDRAVHSVAFQPRRDEQGAALFLPCGLLDDISMGHSKRLKPASGSHNISAQDGPQKLSQRELELEAMEICDRAAQLRELEDLVLLERLDRFKPEDFSRGALCGEGKHALVYRAIGIVNPVRGARGAVHTGRSAVFEEALTATASSVTVEIVSAALSMMSCMFTSDTVRNDEVPAMVKTTCTAMAAVVVARIIDKATAEAVVREAEEGAHSLVFAAKEFRCDLLQTTASILWNARREVGMHLRLRDCDRVVALRGVWFTPRVTLLFDLMKEGSLFHFIHDTDNGGAIQYRRAWEEGSSRVKDESLLPSAYPHPARIAADVADALAALHRAGIVHRDVKSHNVMMFRKRRPPAETAENAMNDGARRRIGQDEGCHQEPESTAWGVKLGDLGSAALVPCAGEAALTEEVGTSGSTAPEV